jgi:HJR/Mrr/RecB family endonuclease
MKTTTVICLLLAAQLCAAAQQTSESEALSPKDISEIVQSAEAQGPSGAHHAVILTSNEEPSSDPEDVEDLRRGGLQRRGGIL